MQKLILKIKNNIWLLLNAIIPFLIFLIPIYTENYVDDTEVITLFYNFYNIFDFNIDIFFSILCLLTIITSLINIFLFILLVINNIKVEFLYNKLIKTLAIINNIVLFLISITMLIYIITVSCYFANIENFLVYNKIHAGTVIFASYCIISNLFIFRIYKRK